MYQLVLCIIYTVFDLMSYIIMCVYISIMFMYIILFIVSNKMVGCVRPT